MEDKQLKKTNDGHVCMLFLHAWWFPSTLQGNQSNIKIHYSALLNLLYSYGIEMEIKQTHLKHLRPTGVSLRFKKTFCM